MKDPADAIILSQMQSFLMEYVIATVQEQSGVVVGMRRHLP